MSSIYGYRDFRKFLQDYYRDQKRRSARFTYASFAQHAGVKSPNYLKLVIDGRRKLTTANIQAFGKAMHLEEDALDFFEAMVLENQAETPAEKKYYARRLTRLRKGASNEVRRQKPSQLLEDSMRIAVLLCAGHRTMQQAANKVTQELGVAHDTAVVTLQSLVNSGDLVQDAQGILRLRNNHTMMSDPKGLSDKQRRFLRDSLNEANAVFARRYPRGAAKFLSLLLTAPSGSLPDLFADLRAAAEKAADLYDPKPGQDAGVYRVQLQVYRVGRDLE